MPGAVFFYYYYYYLSIYLSLSLSFSLLLTGYGFQKVPMCIILRMGTFLVGPRTPLILKEKRVPKTGAHKKNGSGPLAKMGTFLGARAKVPKTQKWEWAQPGHRFFSVTERSKGTLCAVRWGGGSGRWADIGLTWQAGQRVGAALGFLVESGGQNAYPGLL